MFPPTRIGMEEFAMALLGPGPGPVNRITILPSVARKLGTTVLVVQTSSFSALESPSHGFDLGHLPSQ